MACKVLFLWVRVWVLVWVLVLDDGAFVFDVFFCFYVFLSYKTHARARGQHMDLRYWGRGTVMREEGAWGAGTAGRRDKEHGTV